MSIIQFEVGQKYENMKGVYEVLSIEGNAMRIRWESGEEIIIDDPGTYNIELKPSFVVNNTYYVFDHWEDTGSTLNPITVDINDDVTLTAVYKKSKGPIIIPL